MEHTHFSNKKNARIAGIWYLLVAITGGFGLMYVPEQVMVADDAAATAKNILDAELLFRLGILSNLACQTCFVFLVLALDRLLKPVNPTQSRLMVMLVVVSVPIAFLNTLNLVAVLQLVNGAEYLKAFEPTQLQAFAMFFLRLHEQGVVIVEIFWGLWLFPLGYLIFKSGFIPKILGILLMLACVSYLIDCYIALVVPEYRAVTSTFTMWPSTIGELSIVLWLLIMGAKNQPPATQDAEQKTTSVYL